jgi:1-acyl-sn-glycerol-3-phosphate acyltransferase
MSGRPRGRAAAFARALLTGARRLVTVGLLLALVPSAAAVLIVVAVLTAPVSALRRGRWRPVRIASFVLFYLLVDLAGLLAAAAVWLRHPPGTRQAAARRTAATFALLAWLLRALTRAGERLFALAVEVTPAVRPQAAAAAPVVVLARHAGPGDSFLLLHVLLGAAGLRPHTVLKRLLRLDPCLDVVIGRLPHCFLPPPRGRTAQQAVGDLAGSVRAGDALVIFPEGGNFTERRQRRAIASLRRHGKRRAAARAEKLHNVLPPHATGTLAALAGAPGADVVFVAHTGLDAIDSVRTAWQGIPLRRTVRAHWWCVPGAEVPLLEQAREEWLLGQWARVDRWIAAHR